MIADGHPLFGSIAGLDDRPVFLDRCGQRLFAENVACILEGQTGLRAVILDGRGDDRQLGFMAIEEVFQVRIERNPESLELVKLRATFRKGVHGPLDLEQASVPVFQERLEVDGAHASDPDQDQGDGFFFIFQAGRLPQRCGISS